MNRALPIIIPVINREYDDINFEEETKCEVLFMSKYIQYTLQYSCERADEYTGIKSPLNIYNMFRILKSQIAIPYIMYGNKSNSYLVVFADSIPAVYFNEYREASKFLEILTQYITEDE